MDETLQRNAERIMNAPYKPKGVGESLVDMALVQLAQIDQLTTQLQQEREAREAAESWIPVHEMVRNELHDLLADFWYEFTIPSATGGRDAREYAVLVRTEEVLRSAGVLDSEGRYIRAALARPAQADAGEEGL